MSIRKTDILLVNFNFLDLEEALLAVSHLLLPKRARITLVHALCLRPLF